MDPPQPHLLVPHPSIPPPFSAVSGPSPTTEAPKQAPPSPAQPPASTQSPVSAPSPVNSLAPHANATSSPFSHPPYAEMIYTAITALKERDGSSKRAIAKYIERVYSGLPPTHPALLTHHLKRLKNSGLLVMVKKSYMLPRSENADTAAASAAPPTQPSHAAAGGSPSPNPASSAVGLKRGRGRPPKPKPNGVPAAGGAQPNGLPPQVNGQAFVQPISSAPPAAAAAAAAANLPNSVPVGFAPDPASVGLKRRPGRPRKVLVVGQGVQVAPVAVAAKQGRGRGRPPKSGPKRKPKSVGGLKKRPGRPPKNSHLANPVAVPYAAVPAGTAVVPVINVPRPRGRPRKNAPGPVATALQPAAAGGGPVHARRPGRPPKLGGLVTTKPKRSGRPAGRPRKNAIVPSQLPAEAYGELKGKLEYFQSKVKEAVGALKPHLAGAALSAVVAIQELEGIASMDINAPLTLEAPPQSQPDPPQQPLPLPQLQAAQSQLPQTELQPPPFQS
ncbi:hypothetical protein Tsubulata_032572 [Turnera subulata]|uniref:H15 domain-containing protein n=1 Tax=Turnera subulata TaxID=218843 RepID=A0A9Q0FNQ5_9ROSI|nr:hypothetical protein Tsubulata_032572 [Turnera subulata]